MEYGDIRKFIIEEKDEKVVLVEVNIDETDKTPGVNDFCRFCSKYLRYNGAFTNSALIFTKSKLQHKSYSDRLAELGLKLRPNNKKKSIRICRGCTRTLGWFERYFAAFRKWKEEEEKEEHEMVTHETSTSASPRLTTDKPSSADPTCDQTSSPEPASDKRDRSPSPSEPPRLQKKLRKNPASRRSVTQVLTTYPSERTDVKIASDSEAGIISNIANQKWKTAANLLYSHKYLFREIKSVILSSVNEQCRKLTNPYKGFMLWKTSPEEIKSFSFENLIEDLERMSPFLWSIFDTVSKNNQDAACAALCIALRGREPRMSAFAYHINSIITRGGIKKSVFNTLSKMCITTAYSQARQKQKKQAATIEETIMEVAAGGETASKVEPPSEPLLNSETEKNASAADPVEPITGVTDLDNPLVQELPS